MFLAVSVALATWGWRVSMNRSYGENGRNVPSSFHLLFYFMSIIYEDLQIEEAFHLPQFYKH